MPKTLYVCYFGIKEPLVQTQVLPYLREILKAGADKEDSGNLGFDSQTSRISRVAILTFEPDFKKQWTPEKLAEEKASLAAEGIDWYYTGYHKWPSVPATFFDILNGARIVWRLQRRNDFDIFHGRVHLATLIAVLVRKFSKTKPKILFDIRGFFPEEYTDAGVWPEGGWLYRSAKRVERWLMREADGFVVLTEKARDILFPGSAETGLDEKGRPVEVIPCCVDLERFAEAGPDARTAIRSELGITERMVLTYVGSFGGWYLTDEMIDLFAAARERDPNYFVLILTQRDREKVAGLLASRGFNKDDFFVVSVLPAEVPRYLAASDVAVSLIKAYYSKQSSSPTKLAEYLACGLPVIANRGVGDVDKVLEQNGVGVLLRDFSKESYRAALKEVEELGGFGQRCRETASREFDLVTVGGERYRRIYRNLIGNG
ncbi:MAG: glycosyltransferase [Acidobacteriota bacterium]